MSENATCVVLNVFGVVNKQHRTWVSMLDIYRASF